MAFFLAAITAAIGIAMIVMGNTFARAIGVVFLVLGLAWILKAIRR